MNKLTIVAALAMTGLVACDNKGDTADSAGTTTGGTTTGGTTTGGTTTGSSAPTASVTWGGSSVDLTVSGGPGAYWFGMAETTGCDDCWTGEDCVYGYDAGGTTLAYCHDGGDTGTSLAYGGDAGALAAGTTVFVDASFDGAVTYFLDSDSDFGGDGSCYVWGADTSYYDGLGCTSL
jgi:hypothetical protein